MHDDAALELLRTLTIEPVGVLTQASNLTLLVDLTDSRHDGQPTGRFGQAASGLSMRTESK